MGVRKQLVGLVLLGLLPLVLFDAYQLYRRVDHRRQEVLEESMEYAGAIGPAFINYLDSLWAAELALGTTLAYRGLGRTEAEALLREQLSHNLAVNRFSWLSPDGEVIAATDARSYAVRVADRQDVRAILAGESMYISDLMQSRVTGEPMVTVSRGIRQGNQLLGIIVAAVDVTRLDVALPVQPTGGRVFGLVDRQGMLVYRSNVPRLAWERRRLTADGPAYGALRGNQTVVPKYLSAVDNTWRAGAAVPVRSIGWAAYADSTLSDVLAIARSDIEQDLMMIAVVLIGTGLGVLLLERRIVRPILALRGAALTIAGGQRGARVQPAGVDELAATARTFNEMADRIEESESQLHTRAEQQGAVADLGQHALAGTPLPAVMEEAVQILTTLLRVDYCAVMELLPCDDTLLMRAGSGWGPGLVGHLTLPVDHSSQAGFSLLAHEPVITMDLGKESRFRVHRLLQDRGIVSGMTVIIHGSAGPYGVLATHTIARRSFTADDIHFLQAVANVLGTAAQRCNAEAERAELLARERAARADAEAGRQSVETLAADLRTRARQQAAVAELGRLALDLSGTVFPWLHEVSRVVAELLDVRFCAVLEVMGDLKSLILRAGVGWPASSIGHLWAPPGLPEPGMVSTVSVPIQLGTRHYGVLAVHATEGRAFTANDVNFLEAVAHLAAITIGRNSSRRRAATQHAVSRLLAGAASLGEAVPQMLQAVGEGLGWEMGTLWQLSRQSGEVRCSNVWLDASLSEPERAALSLACLEPPSSALLGDGLQGVDAHWIADLAKDPIVPQREPLLAAGFKAAVWVPITVGSEVLGALAFYGRHVRMRNDRTLHMLSMVGSQVGQFVERIRAEAELRALNAQLEARVAERTAELAAANLDLEAFTSSVSHDLRAPLRSIAGFSQALAEDCGPALDASGQAYLRRIREASQRMAHLIDDLLLLSRVTRAGMRRERVDLTGLAVAVADQLPVAEPARAGATFRIEPGLTARGDERLLRVALENLLGNAWKFSAGKPEATITFGCTEQNGKAVFFVRDDGAGFDMADADKLFAPFQRLHASVDFEGSGVGLATVKRIILKHGGQVWGEGITGGGATFYFTL